MTFQQPYTAPGFNSKAYNCPHCNAYARQQFYQLALDLGTAAKSVSGLYLKACDHCREYTLWKDGAMIYPPAAIGELPNEDLPDDIKKDYQEARTVARLSPRSAAALLRLAVQKLCRHLGHNDHNLNDAIAGLVKDGLPPQVQQALDSVRVIGNNSVHPGTIDLNDEPNTVEVLFSLVNLIADIMITRPKSVQAIYSRLPEKDKQNIAKRDSNRGQA